MKKITNAAPSIDALTGLQIVERNGVQIEKGAVLTNEYLEEHKEWLGNLMSIFTAYPDIYLDIIAKDGDGFSLYFYQRIVLRALMRYQDIYITAPRAFSKSFITILALILQCIFMPGTKRFICAPFKTQAAKIATEKIVEIYQHWPLLRREVIGGDVSEQPGNFGKDYVTLKFRNGSVFDVVGASDSQRGGRRHGGLIDEVRDHDADDLNEIVLPLMNVSRRLPDNTVNSNEPNAQQIYMTSAGSQMSFAYTKLIDIFQEAIIQPDKAFTFGCDYRVPVLHGLLDKNFITKLRLSPSYNETSFATEYKLMYSLNIENCWELLKLN